MASGVTEPLPPAPSTLSTEPRGAVGAKGSRSKGSTLSWLGVSAHSSLRTHPHPALMMERGPQSWWWACPALHSQDSGREPAAFLPAPVRLCLEGSGPEPGRGGNQGHGRPGVLLMRSKMELIPPWSSALLSCKMNVAGPLVSGPARGQLVPALPILGHLPLHADSSPIPPLSRTH